MSLPEKWWWSLSRTLVVIVIVNKNWFQNKIWRCRGDGISDKRTFTISINNQWKKHCRKREKFTGEKSIIWMSHSVIALFPLRSSSVCCLLWIFELCLQTLDHHYRCFYNNGMFSLSFLLSVYYVYLAWTIIIFCF